MVTPKRAEATCLIAERRGVAVGVEQRAARVLAALAAVGAAAEAVERDRERLVGLLRDRPERHRSRGEATHDLARGLHLVQGQRLARGHELEQPAQRRRPGRFSSSAAAENAR